MGRATVIGAGVGGLAAAAALQRRGWDVTVLERAAALENVGAGLAVAPNALRALDTLGVGAAIRELSALQGDAGIVRPNGRWLSRTSAEAAEAMFGDPTVVLRRTELVAVLADALAPGTVRFGVTVNAVDADTGAVTVADGPADEPADLVVAADGLYSATRAALFPQHPGVVYAGQTSWRVLAPKPPIPVEPTETWGRGEAVGLTTLADGSVYAYATATVPAGGAAPDDERAELLRRFGGWHEPIRQVFDSATDVLRTDLRCLAGPLPRLHAGRVALLGDAAHAMTPHLGQGACQAIEDAVVLASVVGEPGGLARYTAQRLPRTTMLMNRSRRVCQLTQLSNPVAVALRDGMMLLSGTFGSGPLLRQMQPIFGWRPPE